MPRDNTLLLQRQATMNSRERMLTAIESGTPDHVPLSFMIFFALQARSDGWRDFVQRAWHEGTSFWSPQLYRKFLLTRHDKA